MTTPDLAELRDRPVHSAVDLLTYWQALMGEGGFSGRRLWLTFFETDGVPIPHIVPIDDLPLRPDAERLDGLRMIAHQLVRDGDVGSVAMLLSRPGSGAKTADDRAWARVLAPLTSWPVHLATADLVQVFAADDLLPERS